VVFVVIGFSFSCIFLLKVKSFCHRMIRFLCFQRCWQTVFVFVSKKKEYYSLRKKSLKIPKGGNQNPYIKEERTTQWRKEKVQKDKQRSTKHTHKAKNWVTRNRLKPGEAARWLHSEQSDVIEVIICTEGVILLFYMPCLFLLCCCILYWFKCCYTRSSVYTINDQPFVRLFPKYFIDIIK
jgi:hypothetical protein